MVTLKILVLIAQTTQNPWRDISVYGQGATWLGRPLPLGVEVTHVYGTRPPAWYPPFERFAYRTLSDRRIGTVTSKFIQAGFQLRHWNSAPRVEENEVSDLPLSPSWLVQTWDDYMFHDRSRVAGALIHALGRTWDALILTTASSYLRVDLLADALTVAIERSPYGGRTVQYAMSPTGGNPSYTFASGCCTYLERSFLESLRPDLKRLSRVSHADLALGRLCRDFGVVPAPLTSLDLTSENAAQHLSEDVLDSTVHFRVKSGTWSSRGDTGIMRTLHSRIVGP